MKEPVAFRREGWEKERPTAWSNDSKSEKRRRILQERFVGEGDRGEGSSEEVDDEDDEDDEEDEDEDEDEEDEDDDEEEEEEEEEEESSPQTITSIVYTV